MTRSELTNKPVETRLAKSLPTHTSDSGEDVVQHVIPYKNPKALLGYYLGVFSLIPFVGLLLGPVALMLGFMGLRYRRRVPKAHGLAHATMAIVLGSMTFLSNLAFVTAFLLSLRR